MDSEDPKREPEDCVYGHFKKDPAQVATGKTVAAHNLRVGGRFVSLQPKNKDDAAKQREINTGSKSNNPTARPPIP